MPRVICKQPQTFQEPYTIQTLTFESEDEMIRCDHVFKFLVVFFFFGIWLNEIGDAVLVLFGTFGSTIANFLSL